MIEHKLICFNNNNNNNNNNNILKSNRWMRIATRLVSKLAQILYCFVMAMCGMLHPVDSCIVTHVSKDRKCKGKVVSVHATKACEEVKVWLHSVLTLALDGANDQLHACVALPLGMESPVSSEQEDVWTLYREHKSCSCRDSNHD